jgi:hypothetical protein
MAATSCQNLQKENGMQMGLAYLVVPRMLMIIVNIMLAGVLDFVQLMILILTSY